MSNEPCGLSMTENDIRIHLEILSIAECSLCEEIGCLDNQMQNGESNIKANINRLLGIKRIIDAAARDLQCTHDYLMDEMNKKGMTARFA